MIGLPHPNPKFASLMRLVLAAVVFATPAAFFVPTGSTDPGIIEYIKTTPPPPGYFSPNGDGIQDEVRFRYALSDTAAVWVFVVGKDSSTVVDTLSNGLTQPPVQEHEVVWDGTFFDGTPAPEDTFLAFIRAQNGAETDSMYSQHLFIDVTDPEVVITAIFPGQFAPGSTDPGHPQELDIDCSISDPAPSDSVEAVVVIIDPTETAVETFPGRFVAAGDTFRTIWDGASATEDGLYRIDVTARDRAGNKPTGFDYIDVDVEAPTITITNLENNSKLPVLPDSVFGWAWDRNGVRDSVWVRYDAALPLWPIPNVYFREDTLHFRAPLADSIAEEGTYTLGFEATDLLGQERTFGFTITWDATPLPPPVLEDPPAVTYTSSFLLDGEVSGSFEAIMQIYKNDASPDTIFPNVEGKWPHPMTLDVGLNRIWANMVDNAGNVSDPSNTIEVTYDNTGGLFIPQPFRPGDAFQINLSKPTAGVTLRVYDLGGHLVRTLYSAESAVDVTIPWDGLNGDSNEVKKGPLVAVAFIRFAGEGDVVFREIFLFEP